MFIITSVLCPDNLFLSIRVCTYFLNRIISFNFFIDTALRLCQTKYSYGFAENENWQRKIYRLHYTRSVQKSTTFEAIPFYFLPFFHFHEPECPP